LENFINKTNGLTTDAIHHNMVLKLKKTVRLRNRDLETVNKRIEQMDNYEPIKTKEFLK
jgi:hypothetical protein